MTHRKYTLCTDLRHCMDQYSFDHARHSGRKHWLFLCLKHKTVCLLINMLAPGVYSTVVFTIGTIVGYDGLPLA
ncbi:hypothetical protein CONLIGDRAFT_629822 [Coniochaeta ligniaria NRRL 30616]|uniref:Uncharacterized protein n=1 Tax=Coniochaeta ligniaria NRRL 30616 TaxID=1408157 RepID=A0A1J7JRY8_9PEZI|nr:hypothetical protein CONLIGDRAFT_629822 [Coniochaeta ligniaria NRRL 30616]